MTNLVKIHGRKSVFKPATHIHDESELFNAG